MVASSSATDSGNTCDGVKCQSRDMGPLYTIYMLIWPIAARYAFDRSDLIYAPTGRAQNGVYNGVPTYM